KDGDWRLVKTMRTNADGRTDAPVMAPDAAAIGEYELAFHVGEFYERQGTRERDPLFVDRVVPVRFALSDVRQHYHVPMLCTPWSCSTYRGSRHRSPAQHRHPGPRRRTSWQAPLPCPHGQAAG